MKVLGIDPGLAATGYGLVERIKDDSLKLHEVGVIRTPPRVPLPKRLAIIYSTMRELLREFSPDAMAVEELYFAKNTKTAMAVAQARGVILLAGAQAGIPAESYTPLEVKLQITGFGRASKEQVQGMVARLLSLKTRPKPDDAADALALAICYLLRERGHVGARTA